MAKYTIEDTTLAAIADAVRAKKGSAELIPVTSLATEIESIESGGSTGGEEWIGDGNTHIWISLPEGRTSPMLGVCPKGTVTVDWGDGTAPDVLTGTSVTSTMWTPKHEYAKSGDYVITLTVDGEMGLSGNSGAPQGAYILRKISGNDYANVAYQTAIRKIELGDSVTAINAYSFYGCHSLTSVTIPDGVTNIGGNTFHDCNSLKSVTIPDGAKSIATYMFYNCNSLTSVNIPDSVTDINTSAFYNCYSLASVTIPGGVTYLGINAFNGCHSAQYFDFTNFVAVPSLSSTSVFQNISADCEIRVPAALYDEWIAATNWTTYASRIVAV